MKNLLRRGAIMALLATLGCSQSPSGRWEATQSVYVLLKKGDPQTVAFVLNAGDVCALGQQWSFEKELLYKEVICPQGKGWITSDTPFKKLSG